MLTPLQVTDERDGPLEPRMYPYWANAVVRDGGVYVFVGHADGRPRFIRVDLASRQVERLGPLLSYTGTGEGWHWDAQGRLYLIDGPRLRRVGPLSPGEDEVIFDITETHPGCDLWQSHSSDDGRVHSATVRQIVSNGAYPAIGTVVSIDGQQQFFPAPGALDESHLTGNGRWLLIEDTNDLWIHDLTKMGPSRVIRDTEGALSHCDTGADFIVGEDNFAGACVRLDLATGERRILFRTWGMGHVSVRGDRYLFSDATHISLVAPDGSGLIRRLVEHGMVVPPGTPEWKKYDFQVQANLDPSGRVACYMTNNGGDRQDVFLLIE
jgi:hypothetical protein